MASKTRLTELVRAFDAAGVEAALKESPGLLDYRDERGRNWLHLLCGADIKGDATKAEASVRIADFLLSRGLGLDDPAFTEGEWKATPLWFSIARGRNLRLAEHLLKLGCAPRYSMHAAAFNDDVEAMRLLKSYGADVDESGEGDTPFLFMIKWSRFGAAEALLDLDADVNARDEKGMTALHLMLKKRSEAAHFRMLAARGAKGDIPGPDGQTARQIMRRKKDPALREMAEALL